jgi:tetratricopeptide (TPR) repeat protein
MTRPPVRFPRRTHLVLVLLLAGVACRPATKSDGASLTAPALPNLSGASPSIQTQITERYTALTNTLRDPAAAETRRGEAHGEVGKLLMAADYRDAAEPFFVAAQSLMPTDRRWPYFLGHLYRLKNDPVKASGFFRRVLELKPDDVPALIWLADAYLAAGRPADAEPLLTTALSREPASAAASFRLGNAALARRDYGGAVKYFEQTLARDPKATAVHYPLAVAYRGLGNTRAAEAQLRERGEVEVAVVDPLMSDMRRSLASAVSFETLGLQALDRKAWAEAASYFRQGLDVDPDNPSLRHRLGTALAMMGDGSGARAQFEETVRRRPDYARAHYSLGVMLTESGQPARALAEFSAAVRADPGYVDARFEEAIALSRVERWADSRDRLAEGMKAYPNQPIFAHALARLLAAAPVDGVRDPRRAAALVLELQQRANTAELFETLAMALAAAGSYDEAIRIQRGLVTSARAAGRADAAGRLTSNLSRYQRHQPPQVPWTRDEPVAQTLALR